MERDQMSETERPTTSISQVDRQEQLAELIDRARQQPGLAALMDVYQQDWFRLGTAIAAPLPRTMKSVRVSTDSTPSLL